MSRPGSISPPVSPGFDRNTTLLSMGSSGTLYNTALDSMGTFSSFNDSGTSDTNVSKGSNCNKPSPTEYEHLFYRSNSQINQPSNSNASYSNTSINGNNIFEQSESLDTNDSQEEIDPKSQLANKTIFKTDNPNLSIIEINDNSFKEQDIENSVVLIEEPSEGEIVQLKKTSSGISGVSYESQSAADRRRKKAEALLHCSKQKLDIAIAEALAVSGKSGTSTNDTKSEEPRSNLLAIKNNIKVYDTLEEFEQNLPSTVTVLNTPFGSKVYLVGTAHFSEDSQDDVSFVIRNVRPDVVMVELCPSRIHILKLDEQTLLEEAKNFNLSKIRGIIQAHGYVNGIFFILLLQMSAQIARDLGMAPGGEFRRAFEEVHKLPGCMLHLGDRPIRITLHRALRALSLWQTIKLVWRLTSTDTISIEEVEECKQRDLLEKLMQEMAGEFPAFSDVFVTERDMFLCHSLQLASLPQVPADGSNLPRPVRVVGVVGIGHANGIAEMWGKVDPQAIPDIMSIPPPRISTRIAKFTIKYGFIGLTLYGAFKLLRPRLVRLF